MARRSHTAGGDRDGVTPAASRIDEGDNRGGPSPGRAAAAIATGHLFGLPGLDGTGKQTTPGTMLAD